MFSFCLSVVSDVGDVVEVIIEFSMFECLLDYV